LPPLSVASPCGFLNVAVAPGPFADPLVPAIPANVETSPAGVIFRIACAASSAT